MKKNKLLIKKISRKKWTEDLTGNIYGKVKVLGYVGVSKRGNAWDCLCECGNKIISTTGYLKNGNSTSCGCDYINPATTHNKYHTKEYRSWTAMKTRCLNKNSSNYLMYGGRGIFICDRWIENFEYFLSDMGYAPSDKHSIERVDNNSGYFKENCKWANIKEQCKNRRNNRWYEINGERMIIVDWAKKLKISHTTINQKINKGYTFEQIYNHYITNPKKGTRIKKHENKIS